MAEVAVSPPKFKVGDRVRCITMRDPEYDTPCYFGDSIVIGGIYTVRSLNPKDREDRIYLINDFYHTPSVHLFQLVPSKPFVKSEWM